MFRFSTLNVLSLVVFAISLIFFNCSENNFLLSEQWWVISKSKIQIKNEKRLKIILLIDICIISMWTFDVKKVIKSEFVVKMFFFLCSIIHSKYRTFSNQIQLIDLWFREFSQSLLSQISSLFEQCSLSN